MNVQPWLVVAGALFLLGHAVVLLFVYRLRQGGELLTGTAPDADGGTGDSAVDCRECGAKNDGQYRFCRECTAELPGGLTSRGTDTGPDSRGML